jgi:Domain of unknown function (DUF3846)
VLVIRFAVLWPASDEGGERVEMHEIDAITEAFLRGLLGGGYFEMVTLRDGCGMYIDEDGKRKRLKPNELATELAREMAIISAQDYIAGIAVVVGPPDADGNETSLTGVTLEWVMGAFQ